MKKKGFILLFFLALFGASFSYFFLRNLPSSKEKNLVEKRSSFFIEVPIECFSSGRTPCITISVGKKNFLMELDLGSNGNLSVLKDYLGDFPGKKIINSTYVHGFRGKKFPVKRYEIEEIKIGALNINDLILEEWDLEHSKGQVIYKSDRVKKSQEIGLLGWPTFYHSNLFLDCKNKKIAFCDSVETLKEEGIPIHKFIKTSLSLENKILEFIVDTEKGPLRCFLDSGSTLNIINGEIEGDASMEEWVMDQKSHFEMESFKVEGKEFGPQPFCTLPLKFSTHVEAIVGAEFLQDHVVFIDFKNRHIYLAPSEDLESSLSEELNSESSK